MGLMAINLNPPTLFIYRQIGILLPQVSTLLFLTTSFELSPNPFSFTHWPFLKFIPLIEHYHNILWLEKK